MVQRDYETMYIIKPTLDEDAIEVVTKKVDDQISALGTLEKTEKRGRKRLAYEVKDFKDGFYVLTNFKAEPKNIAELERLFKLNDDVIRHIIVRPEEA